MIRAPDELHVLGTEVVRHRVLDRTRIGERERARRAAERTADDEPREPAEPRERQEPAPARVGRVSPETRDACATTTATIPDHEAEEAGDQRELRAAERGHDERDGAAEQREEDQRAWGTDLTTYRFCQRFP